MTDTAMRHGDRAFRRCGRAVVEVDVHHSPAEEPPEHSSVSDFCDYWHIQRELQTGIVTPHVVLYEET